ncbi:hypothetical protein ACF0H5_024221 [Mactra antiquata]
METEKETESNKGNNQVSNNGHVISEHEKCMKHYKRLKYYCVDDDLQLCSVCAIFDHKKCENVDVITTAASKEKCDVLRDKLDKTINETLHVVDILKEAEEFILGDSKTVLVEIKKSKETVLQIFESIINKITTETNDLMKTRQNFDDVLQVMKDFMVTLDSMKDSQRCVISHGLKDEILKVIDTTYVLRHQLNTFNFTCKFDEHQKQLRTNVLSALPLEIQLKVKQITKAQPLKTLIVTKTTFDLLQPLYRGYDFLSDDRLIVVDFNNSKVILFDNEFGVQNTYNLPYGVSPLDVLAVNNGEVIITTGNDRKLIILSISDSGDIKKKMICNVTRSFSCISTLDDTHFVVSTIEHKTPFRMVTLSGKEKKFDINIHQKKYQAAACHCAFIQHHDKVVFTDKFDDKIFIYDILTGDKSVVVDDQIKSPCDVSVGLHDHVFVCCEKTDCIVELSPAGQILSFMKLPISGPRYIAISQDKQRLLVANSDTCLLYQVLAL